MPGAGTHLHDIIKAWFNEDYKPGCGCRAVVEKMDKHPPQWSLDNIEMIAGKLRAEAGARHWWAKLALALPGSKRPLRALVRRAVELAEADLKAG